MADEHDATVVIVSDRQSMRAGRVEPTATLLEQPGHGRSVDMAHDGKG
jgi:hypothetical protein